MPTAISGLPQQIVAQGRADTGNRVCRQVAGGRQLTPEELGQLAKRMTEAKDPAEADRLQEEIERGFYGGALGPSAGRPRASLA
jgi:hypothetical protein